MHDTKLDQLNKARVKGYSKYCQGRAHAKLLKQHVFKPYIWPNHCKHLGQATILHTGAQLAMKGNAKSVKPTGPSLSA